MQFLPYYPGVLPTRPAPEAGERLVIEVAGFPPAKRRGGSIRNRSHPKYADFVRLREAATSAMGGRAWYFGAIALVLKLRSPEKLDYWGLHEYVGGIMDTLDGSSGPTFTYLPIVFEDDCQVRLAESSWEIASAASYRLEIQFGVAD